MYAELFLPIGLIIGLGAVLIIVLRIAISRLRGPVTPPPAKPAPIPPSPPDPGARVRVWYGKKLLTPEFGVGTISTNTNGHAKSKTQVVKNRPIGRAKIWLDECTERRAGDAISCTHHDAWVHYLRWCHANGRQHLPRTKFLSLIGKEVPLVAGEKRFAGLLLVDAA